MQHTNPIALSTPAAGKILVVHPEFDDPMFKGSVIFLLAHDHIGTAGVNIAPAECRSAIDSYRRQFGEPPADQADSANIIYRGGPCQAPTLVLHEVNANPIGDSGYGVHLIAQDELLAALPPTSMILSGYAGWGEGQLEHEIELGVWKTTTATLTDLLQSPVSDRWRLANRHIP